MQPMNKVLPALFLSLAVLLSACSSDAYDSGDGPLSYMCADMAMARVGGDGMVHSVAIDGHDMQAVARPFKCEWMEKEDTAYRTMLYYNKVGDETALTPVDVITAGRVLVTSMLDSGYPDENLGHAPLAVKSGWISGNGSLLWLNLEVEVLTGKSDAQDAGHVIACRLNSLSTDEHGVTYSVSLHHDRGSDPQYYTVTAFVSVPLAQYGITADPLRGVALSYDSYEGDKKLFIEYNGAD